MTYFSTAALLLTEGRGPDLSVRRPMQHVVWLIIIIIVIIIIIIQWFKKNGMIADRDKFQAIVYKKHYKMRLSEAATGGVALKRCS